MQEIIEELETLDTHVEQHYFLLNQEGVWLFLATLGCWGVEHSMAQLYAIAVAFILFSYRIYIQWSDKRPFPIVAKTIKDKIMEQLEEGSDSQKARLYDLHQIMDVKASKMNAIKSSFIFLLSYSFLGVTLVHWFTFHGA